ncbi:MAG TPA: carboxymuconolactone decarboxylase family protein [Burkholderiales bacterium]|jgi:AhpD family alkylhydroperoxidase|nr:carboxymuconolactone decarboxylase family protein [Burkholderiales bacterium]
MSLARLHEYEEASPEVRAVYDDIMQTRGTDWINNFWKALANDPAMLKRTWDNVKQVMAPGALDPLVKEMVYVAVSATNGCEYCTYSHTAAARKKGMSDAMFLELMAVVGLANETNRLANGLRPPVDPQFKP